MAVVGLLVVVVALPALPVTEVGAEPTLEELQRETEEADRALGRQQEELREAEDQLHALEADFALAVEEYNEAQEELRSVESGLAELKNAIGELTSSVSEHEGQVAELVRELYMRGGSVASYDAVLGAEGVDESARRLSYIRSSQQGQLLTIESYLAERDVLDRHRVDLRTARTRQAELTAQLEEQRVALEERVEEQGDEIAELETVVAGAREELDQAQDAEASEEERLEAERREAQRREQERQELARADRGSRDDSESSDDSGSSSVAAPASAAQAAVDAAMGQLGTPYRWGGNSPSGFDCSGLTSWAYAQAGVSIPRTSSAQYSALPKVSRSDLQPGDLLFFNSPISHVGMYIGGGQMVESPHSGTTVRTRSIERGGYVGAVRPTG